MTLKLIFNKIFVLVFIFLTYEKLKAFDDIYVHFEMRARKEKEEKELIEKGITKILKDDPGRINVKIDKKKEILILRRVLNNEKGNFIYLMFLLKRESSDGNSGIVLPISNIKTEISIKGNFSINSEGGKFITKEEDVDNFIKNDLRSLVNHIYLKSELKKFEIDIKLEKPKEKLKSQKPKNDSKEDKNSCNIF